ncbi:helix-turn-helix domain-containing protein [Nordella sp. HKS 07]|uniref:GlxA family transcriptional regulator n=1 Tax=Nordella sp. HKS 07 TaxID=2712222 RepID=UPI0013E186D8|nr:helix-turn-helix domain-containing protein [Nordella sp. HKS 07]QIG50789.1 helix-turn-helix domain-containing protein [Nordella sp. HKS 07]
MADEDRNALSDSRPRFAFILQPEFPMNAFILATEALRIANQNSGQDLFDWLFVSESGQPVRASNGMRIDVHSDLAALPQCDYLILLEGNLPTQNNSPQLLQALRAAHRHGATVIAVDTGAFALARAGLTGERRLVLHWEAMPAYLEHFPDAEIANQLYLLDKQLGFCAGGVGMLDLMLELIGRLRGAALAREVANALIHTPREATRGQRVEGAAVGAVVSMSRRVIALMERHLDFPLSPRLIADKLGISVRTLERYCAREFGQTPTQLYLLVRLQAARNLLFYEEGDIKDIAVACGFSYPAVFTRAFKAQFGQSPRAFRQSFRDAQGRLIRPEIARLSAAKRH